MKKRVIGTSIFLLCLLSSMSSLAASTSTTFAVTANVNDICNIAATPLAFGNFDPTGSAVQDGVSTLTVLCTNGTPYEIGLDAGSGAGATVERRKMTDLANNVLEYSLYQNGSRSVLWGNTIGNNTWAGTGTGAQEAIIVYGRILSGQAAAPVGAYLDMVTVSVNY